MDRAALDAAYLNTKAVPDFPALLASCQARSAALYAATPGRRDLRYGAQPAQRFDWLPCGQRDAPLFVFIHGGYWQRNSKDIFSCMMAGPMAQGFEAAMIGYTLCPDVTLTELVDETHAAIRFLRKEGPRRGFGAGKLVVSGWSAGGHLTASALPLDEVDAGLAISGIYDVEPCRLNYLNDKLKLTAAEAVAMSPILHLEKRKVPVTVAFGTGELPDLQRQSRDYHQARVAAGLPSKLLPLDPCNQFSIMDEMEKPEGRLTAALNDLIVGLR